MLVKAVPAVVRKVLFADGFSIKVSRKDGLPWKKGFIGFIVDDAKIELLAEVKGETGEFAKHRREGRGLRDWWSGGSGCWSEPWLGWYNFSSSLLLVT
jgi:hypothetical protein